MFVHVFIGKTIYMLKFGKKKAKHYIRYRTKNIYNTYFKDESVTTQAQLLLSLLKSRKLKRSYIIIGYSKVDKGYKGATECL